MYNEAQARQKVLGLVNEPGRRNDEDEFVISSARLSPNKDYWIVTANSKAYVENRDLSRCYVGVGAYMVNAMTGEIQIIGSAESPEIFLQDKYDLEEANGKNYMLQCAHDAADKYAIVNIRKVFNCSFQKARELTREKRQWFTGRKRYLQETQDMLSKKGIKTKIVLTEENKPIPVIDSEIIWWEAMEEIITEKLIA